ncbi:hypothetical protein PGIGA_G00259470 [Pangasianodon gigas]|uniref:Uncharacterized protein n=1 Tax=Pangasianodon gigas TaxID=30993 RepID=A0ACC5WSL7_PANGG|nr:hypothetical protein [Pangasianodon gigas]
MILPADDVILAQWLEENIQLSDAISQAVQCALKILDECNVQRIVHSRKPRVKIAISAGRFSRVSVGDEEHQICVVFGPAVEDIRSAEALAEPGKIILSPEAWRLYDRENLTVEPIENEEAVTIYETGRGEHLQEIWPSTIMFVNLHYAQTLMDLRGSCHKVSEIIAEQMFSCRAEICNIFFFEEGCIFLGVVGLPGDKRQEKAAVALQAAYRIHETCLQEISSLSTVSVGVTTGRVLYSLEQLPLNKKYTAYGHIVNLAAKLTTDYPGIVSCDVATKLYSMLPLSCLRDQVTRSQYDGVRYQDEINQM